MSDKERLEEIKNSYLEGIHGLFGSSWVSMPKENFEWLIEQAERVQDLKIMLKVLGELNQRYKHALEEISNADCNLEGLDAERELDKVTDVAFKALEEEI